MGENPAGIVLRWDEDVAGMVGQMPDQGRLLPGDFDPNALRGVEWLQDALARLVKRGRNHPADAGFVAGQLAPGENDHDPLHRGYGTPLEGEFPGDEVDLRAAWFPPGADPNLFGTVYVTHTERPPNRPERPEGSQPYWILGQVGLSGRLGQARWDDAEGCAALFAAATDPDTGEAGMVSGALTVNNFAERRTHAEKRRQTIRARELFTRPRDRIKPRLVEDAWHKAYRNGFSDKATAAGFGMSFVSIPLNDDEMFGWDSQPKPMHPAAYVRPITKKVWSQGGYVPVAPTPGAVLTVEAFDEVAVTLQKNLDGCKLGVVCRYQKTVAGREGVYPHLIVAKNPELMFECAAACDVPDGALVERLTVNGDGTASWVPLGTTNYH